MPSQLVAGENDGEAGDPEGELLGYDQPEELKAGFSEFSPSRPQLDAPAPTIASGRKFLMQHRHLELTVRTAGRAAEFEKMSRPVLHSTP